MNLQYNKKHKRNGWKRKSDYNSRADTRTLSRILSCLNNHRLVNITFIRDNTSSGNNMYKLKDGIAFLRRLRLVKKITQKSPHCSILYTLTKLGEEMM